MRASRVTGRRWTVGAGAARPVLAVRVGCLRRIALLWRAGVAGLRRVLIGVHKFVGTRYKKYTTSACDGTGAELCSGFFGIMHQMKQEIESAIGRVVQRLSGAEAPAAELTRPDEQFGDYATNIALRLAKPLGKNPREVAESMATELRTELADIVSEVSIAGPGFINLRLTDRALVALASQTVTPTLKGKTVVAEYSDPNPFKMMHAGHVYTTVVGGAIANLLEAAGGTVHRVNYGGDVGLHVGKTMWAILRSLGGEQPDKLAEIPVEQRSQWLSKAYIEGNNAYATDEAAKEEITGLNKRVYQLHADDDHQSAFAQIYWTCRQWSYEAFDEFYARLDTSMERYYPESEVADLGLRTVKQHLGTVFEESDGAVIFNGEKYGLHTRVFINKQGIPTYEAKEVGLIQQKKADYNFDASIVITGNEQEQYMAVVLKAIEQFMPELTRATVYVPHGMVKLAGGVKMSSRLGNIIPANEVLDITAEAIKATGREVADQTVLGAIKYAFLKTRLGGDLIYDPKESVSLEGNSGPYLQYAHARARSILRKAEAGAASVTSDDALEAGERAMLRKISEYPEAVDKAVSDLMPHHVCTYLYELAQTFNRFYEKNLVVGDPRQAVRLKLVQQYADVLKSGLGLLGITAPERM